MVHAQSAGLSTSSEGDIRFSMDTAIFALFDSDSQVVEVYFQVDVGELAESMEGEASFQTLVELFDASGETLLDDREWISEVEYTPDRQAVNITLFALAPGEEYTLRATVTDRENGLNGTAERAVVAPETLVISELELASALVTAREGSTSPLLKGSVIVFPAADGHFALPSETRAYVYAELYVPGDTISLRSSFLNASGEAIYQRPWHRLAVPDGAPAVGFFDSLDVSGARTSGLHYIEMALATGDGDTLVRRKPIMLSRIDLVAGSGDGSAAAAIPDTGEVYIEQLKLVLTPAQISLLERLDSEEAMREFYVNYWMGRVEERVAFEARCEDSESYATPFREGYETDRGRVHIIYGPPDDVESVILETDVHPHEIWKYYVGGGETFVFLDRDGSGSFEQIYSTVDGELSYENWQEMLMPVGARSGGW
jgi:GWxTD domain-containing protein